MSQYLGDISAYALAVSQGYTGTEEEYAELMASYATVGQTAVTAAQTATNKAAEAQADADAAALDASQALSAASTATTKATEATTAAATATSAATTATTAKDDAVSAKTAAQTAQTGAETAAASVEASAEQIATNAEDIRQLGSEFTALAENVSDGKVTFTNIIQGDSDSLGRYVANANRIRIAEKMPVKKGESVHFTSGTTTTKIIFNKYTTAMGWLGNTGWETGDAVIDIDFDGFIIIIWGNNDLTQITPSDYDATTYLATINGNRINAVDRLSNKAMKRLTYKQRDMYVGLTTRGGTTDVNYAAISTPKKIALSAGESINIVPTIFNNDTNVIFRVVAYANGDMDGTLGTAYDYNTHGTNKLKYTQPEGYSYVLIGLYYTTSDGTKYDNVINNFATGDTVLTVEFPEETLFDEVPLLSNDYYLNICNQSGNVGGELINTRLSSVYGLARIINKVPISTGDVVSFGVNEYWLPSTFSYQYIFTDENDIIIAHSYPSFQIASKGEKITFTAANDGYAVIAIRYDSNPIQTAINGKKAPSEVVDITVTKTISVDSVSICDNNTVYTDDGKLKNIRPSLSTQFCVHRGWINAPNNTIQSFWNAKKNGYSLVECDVRYSSDGVLLLSHDETITGTVDGTATTYTVANETFATLSQLKFSNTLYPNCSAPSLDSVLAFGRSAQIKYLFDCKTPSAQMAIDMMQLVKKYNMVNDVIFNTNRNTIMASKLVELDPNVNLLFAISTSETTFDSYLGREGKTYLSVAISNVGGTLSEAEYFQLAKKGYVMGVWNVANTDIATACRLKPYFIEMSDGTKSYYDWFSLMSNAIMTEFGIVY